MRATRPVSFESGESDSSAAVLVVEPEEPVRSLIRRILEAEGFRVLEASCAREALRLPAPDARSLKLIVTDIAEPGIAGSTGLRERLAPGAVVLRLSVVGPGWWRQERGESSTYVLARPFAGDNLADTVHELLQARSSDRGPGKWALGK